MNVCNIFNPLNNSHLLKVGLSMQIGDLTKLTNPTKIDSSWPNLTLPVVGDGS